MPRITTPGGVELAYETAGSPDEPPVLMVMGFGAQLITWPRGFLERLAAGGRHVISFDNRDCGLSSKLDGVQPDLEAIAAAAAEGRLEDARRIAPYTLSAMSDDALALLDALAIERAHVVGVSMGGMIAQTMAIEHPRRLLTLTSMMSTTGEPEYGQPGRDSLAALLAPRPSDRAGYIETAERALLWRSRRYPDAAGARELAAQSYDRCHYPEGTTRQLAAMLASGSRAQALRGLSVPTLVIHGLDDTLIAPSGGERTAELIPGARLELVPDMGHDRPEPLWPRLCDAILAHTA
jgi:pimeloyl-ACP methyl ester carboxylesterase